MAPAHVTDGHFVAIVLYHLDAVLRDVSVRYGDAIAEEVHGRLLRRMETGRSLVAASGWLQDGEFIEGSLHLWLREAVQREAYAAATARSNDGEALLAVPSRPERAAALGVLTVRDEARLLEDEGRLLLRAVQRVSRRSALRPATREVGLAVLEGRLRGEETTAVATRLALRPNTARQYHRRLLAGIPEKLRRRIDRHLAALRRLEEVD